MEADEKADCAESEANDLAARLPVSDSCAN
jgi:hypothetical protein